MQMLVKEAGGKLSKIDSHVATRHSLFQKDNALPLPKYVNSFHNWGLIKCPKNYSILATAKDGSIEAISHNNLPWEGWMWHPEREELFSKNEINRARNLLLKHAN
jgi:putative glutamine amidotransferase